MNGDGMNDKKHPRNDSGLCLERCAGGNPCALSAHRHSLHVCGDPACACHQPSGYGMVRVERYKLPVYVRMEEIYERR